MVTLFLTQGNAQEELSSSLNKDHKEVTNSSENSMEDILEEIAALKYQNRQLVEMVSELSNRVSSARNDLENATSVLSLAVEDNKLLIQDNKDNIGLVSSQVNINDGHIISAVRRIDENKEYIDQLSIRGAQCGYRYHWTTADSTITYEKTLLNV